ncbi:MAG: hypothetical protein P4L69_05075 [Desulfosporosinus sp.]|nr:hypothetical protein [Desulfosporosinus sp.]
MDLDDGPIYEVVVPNLYLEDNNKSIAVDLSNVIGLVTDFAKPHMTVLSRTNEPFTQEDLVKVILEATKWLEERKTNVLSFTLKSWGPKAKLVKGPLQGFGLHLKQFFDPVAEEYRPLIIQVTQKPVY